MALVRTQLLRAIQMPRVHVVVPEQLRKKSPSRLESRILGVRDPPRSRQKIRGSVQRHEVRRLQIPS